MYILGIETSCDETSVAVLGEDGSVVSNLIASQVRRHEPFGGVVPEIASREHLANLMPLLAKSLDEAAITLDDVSAVAVTAGPGLIGALLVGVAGAQGLAWGRDIALVPVNHLEGHIFSGFLLSSGPADPIPGRFLSLVVSGGHSSVYDVTEGSIMMVNRTRDDAAGEVFDKVAKFLGFPYPGGPHIETASEDRDRNRFEFSIARFKEETKDFSFSGLKSTAIRIARQHGLEGAAGSDKHAETIGDFCASFQGAIGDQLLDRLTQIWDDESRWVDGVADEVGLAGGVAANGSLRRRLERWCAERSVKVRLAERRFCTDNGAMIAWAGAQSLKRGEARDPRRVPARSRIRVGETF